MQFTDNKAVSKLKIVSKLHVVFLNLQLRGLIQVESINVGVVHQEKITGITVGLLWDAPVFVTHVCTFVYCTG